MRYGPQHPGSIAGRRPGVAGGAMPGVPSEPSPPRSALARSPQLDLGLSTRAIAAGFTRIARTSAEASAMTLPNIPAMYGLKRVRIPDDTGDELAYLGADVFLLPPDVDGSGIPEDSGETTPNGVAAAGAGAGVALPWGNTGGLSAAIVIGVNLPNFVEQGWSQSPLRLPGLQNDAASYINAPRDEDGLLCVAYFPKGKLNDPASSPAVPYRFDRRGGMFRLAYGQTLDIAFVARRSQIAASFSLLKYVCGGAWVNVIVAETVARAQFNG